MLASAGVDEGCLAMVSLGRNKGGDINAVIGWEMIRLAFTVENRITSAKAASGVDLKAVILRQWHYLPSVAGTPCLPASLYLILPSYNVSASGHPLDLEYALVSPVRFVMRHVSR